MRAMRIEFARLRPASTWPARVILLIAAAALAASTVDYIDQRSLLAQLQADLRLAQAARQQARPVQPAQPRLVLSDNQVRAVNAAIEQLNLPWPEIFALLERSKSDKVALLALEPDGRKRLVQIQAEARTPEHMLAFVERLRQQPEVEAAYLTKHEINDRDANRPYRFRVDLRWQPALQR